MTVPADGSPTSVSSVAALLAAILAAIPPSTTSDSGLLLALLGLIALVAGLVLPSRGVISAGGLGLFAGALFAGIDGASPIAVLFGVVLAVVAWDLGQNALSLGRQLGRAAETARTEAVHAAGSVGVGVGSAGLGYGVYLGAAGGQPVAALVLLLFASVLVVLAIRRRE